MDKGSVKFNIILVTVFSLITVAFVFWQASNNYIFVNETIALILLIGSIAARWLKYSRVQITILFLLLLPLFSLLNYSYTVVDGDTSTVYHSARFGSLINPVVFLIIIIYLIINASVVVKSFRHLFKGTDGEIKAKEEKVINFYYKRFKASSDDELDKYYKMYNDYPLEAQVALQKIHKERNLNILQF